MPSGDFSRIRNVDLRRFTIDRLMLIVNRLGSRVEVAVRFRQKAAGRQPPAA
jgi:predicted XRE-type DNA-binding protein